MNLVEEAFNDLFPEKEESRKFLITYSGKFRKLNANVKYTREYIHFYLSKEWLEFSEDLRKGLVQSLLIKVFRKYDYNKTFELDLYEKFVSNLGKYAKVEHSDPSLEESFRRINKIYFNNEMEKPNLLWGQDAMTKLGHYEYATNTVVISSIFKKEQELIDYIMHHELLHKKHGNKTTKTGRSIHHSSIFRKDEAKYHDKDAEKKTRAFVRRQRVKKAFRFF